ncbi:MAG: phosphoribosylamine--glycine ligase [Proteobacteria bacterium]|nr:phosphoribosylamine--glycine ligase [Pseudomonadota bacterium]
MKILVVGGGGREHAIAWRLTQSPRVSKVFVAPGNAGTQLEERVHNVPLNDIEDLINFATTENIYITVVGPEVPLSEGMVDAFKARGLKIFGPVASAARLESSKDFAKRFMSEHNIPTAEYGTFTDPNEAHTYISNKGAPIVVKADGLAAGKGVIVAMSEKEAHDAVDMMLVKNGMGIAGAKVVIEEFLIGEEASFIVMLDGEHILPLATSQDHKRLLDGDQGPNTGGMGAYSPAPVVTPEIYAKTMKNVIEPIVQGMSLADTPFVGFLYAGLMIAPDQSIKVLEFNCRLGDPEAQPIMMRLKSDLLVLIEHALAGTLNEVESEWDRRTALGVVLAAENYPDSPRKGDVITLPEDKNKDVHVFHAGTSFVNDQIVTNGGRVLCVTAFGENVAQARGLALRVSEKISFAGKQYRTDIGNRAIKS